MTTFEQIQELVMHPDAPARDELIFTPKEVRQATGLTVGTLNNRAYRMGIKRKGYYTLDEVLRVLSTPMKSYKLFDTEYVELLREKLIERLGSATKQEADRKNLRNGG